MVQTPYGVAAAYDEGCRFGLRRSLRGRADWFGLRRHPGKLLRSKAGCKGAIVRIAAALFLSFASYL